ncbi:MAG: hypothetical protein ACLFSQ_10470 [Candidatus Zixiibacteriota bacterium]
MARKIFDYRKPAGWVHTAAIFFFAAFLLQFFNVFAIFIESPILSLVGVFVLYLIGAIMAIIALNKSKKANDADKLSLFGYIEAGLCILPAILMALYTVFAIIYLS